MISDDALLTLLRYLKEGDYQFVTPTPATHARVIARRENGLGNSLADVLGWSLPFKTGTIAPNVERLLREGGMLTAERGLLRSRIRVSSLHDSLYLHSAFPTESVDAVFFGPDSYRFADLIEAELADCDLNAGQLIMDVGTGAGVGAIVAGRLCPDAAIAMTDINPQALRLARINATAAGIDPITLLTDRLEGIEGAIDLVMANPPYIMDDRARLYRDGGAMHGGQITYDMASFILPRLAEKGRLILYSGSAIVDGRDELGAALNTLADANHCLIRYREMDPDVFGEELEKSAYRAVDRIAVITAIFERR